MAEELRRHVTKMARSKPAFLAELNREVSRAGVALGWFGRFAVEKEKPEHRGKINLKHRGTLPLVCALRLLSLRAGIEETASLGRIAALHEAGVLNDDEADYLGGGFGHITGLLLRQQLDDFMARQPVTNYVHPDDLSKREKDILLDSLKAIDDFAKRIHAEFTAEVL
jgi:signal-transduction protein with cAMP-binding, CBS, and nucleotidyltransferase domain